MTEQEREQIRRRVTRRRPNWTRLLLAALCAGTLANSFAVVAAFFSIQNQREASIRAGCLEQNQRHDGTVSTLDMGIDSFPPGARRERAERSRRFTLSLIESLAPKRDCDALVRKSLGQ